MTGPSEQTQATRPAAQRSPEELRADLEELRGELGETVEELAQRADVPARARAKKDETVQRVQQQAVRVRDLAQEKAPEAQRLVQEQPAAVAAAAVALLLLVVRAMRRRRRRNRA